MPQVLVIHHKDNGEDQAYVKYSIVSAYSMLHKELPYESDRPPFHLGPSTVTVAIEHDLRCPVFFQPGASTLLFVLEEPGLPPLPILRI